MLSNEKEPVCVKSDKSNSLVISLSQYFGYDCIIEISSWDKGIIFFQLHLSSHRYYADVTL